MGLDVGIVAAAASAQRRQRTIQMSLFFIILATLPCYCVGLVLLAVAPRDQNAPRPQTTQTPAQILSVTATGPTFAPTITPVGFASPTGAIIVPSTPTQIFFPTATRFIFPTLTDTPFIFPTPTFFVFPTLTDIPIIVPPTATSPLPTDVIMTPPIVITKIELSLTPTLTGTPTASETPSNTPDGGGIIVGGTP